MSVKKIALNLPDSAIYYYPYFLKEDEATCYFEHFRKTVAWQQDTITLFGKQYVQPRLTALFATNAKPYSYSGIVMKPNKFTPELQDLKQKVKTITKADFTTCLLNLYRHGQDSNGWHADNEKELGQNPVIASITLGQERYFHLKHRKDPKRRHKILLRHGSLLLMEGETQRHWLHQIPKTAKQISERINLTFRVIT